PQPRVIRPSAEVQIISVITMPAPPSALPPRCRRWKSVGRPATATYWSIGETMTRLCSVSPGPVAARRVTGWNIGGVWSRLRSTDEETGSTDEEEGSTEEEEGSTDEEEGSTDEANHSSQRSMKPGS